MNRAEHQLRETALASGLAKDPDLASDIIRHLDAIHLQLVRQEKNINLLRERQSRLARAFRAIPAIKDLLQEMTADDDP